MSKKMLSVNERKVKDDCTSWFYLSFVALVTFFVFGFLDSYGVLLVFLVKHFEEKNSKAAWVGSSAMFGCFFLYPIALRCRYVYGIRTTVFLATALLLPLFILSPIVPSMNLMFLTYSLPFAIAGSIIDCATFTTILDRFERHKGLAFGVRLGSNALGTIAYSWALPILLTQLGWKHAFWALTCICLITFCYALVYNENRASDDGTGSGDDVTKARDTTAVYRELLRNRELVVYLVANTIFVTVIFMAPIFMVQFANNLGHEISMSKWLMVTRGIVAVVIRFTAGRLGDVASRHRRIRHVTMVIVTLFSVATLLCSLSTQFPMLMVYMVAVSTLDSVHWINIPLLVAEITRGVNADHAVALFNFAASFATLAGPPVLGCIYDNTGDHRHVMYTTSAVSAIAACLIIAHLSHNQSSQSQQLTQTLINNDLSCDGNNINTQFKCTIIVSNEKVHTLQFLTTV